MKQLEGETEPNNKNKITPLSMEYQAWGLHRLPWAGCLGDCQ